MANGDFWRRGTAPPRFTAEEQEQADEFAKRHQAELWRRRTAESPGMSDDLWRATRKGMDVASDVFRPISQLAKGFMLGSESGAFDPVQALLDPSNQDSGRSEMSPLERVKSLTMDEVGEGLGLAVMPLGSPLRSPAYRSKMIEKFLEQIGKLRESGDFENTARMAEWLADTKERIAAAFQHSGGVIRRNPGMSPEWIEQAIERKSYPLVRGQHKAGSGPLVEGLRDVTQGPTIDMTPEDWQFGAAARGEQPLTIRRRWEPASAEPRPNIIDPGETFAHEFTHYAQSLGDPIDRRAMRDLREAAAARNKVVGELQELGVSFPAVPESEIQRLVGMERLRAEQLFDQLREETRRYNRAFRQSENIVPRVERGAEKAGANQSARFRRHSEAIGEPPIRRVTVGEQP